MSYEIAPAFEGLRRQAFTFHDQNAPPGAPYGVIMETGYPEGIVTLVVLSDGTVSLYFSNGSGAIGAGKHPGPSAASRRLGLAAAHFAPQLPVVTDITLPQRDEVKIYVLLDGALRGVSGRQKDFGENRLPLSPLFHEAHGVIAAIRAMPT